MNEESRKRKIGLISKISDFEAVTWEIPNFSSIPHIADYAVRSPSFSFKGATWILKLYPYGQTQTKAGYIDMIIDRLHSQCEAHLLYCQIYCKNFLNEEVILHSEKYILKPEYPCAKAYSFMKNLKESPYKWKFAPNDVFTLVCAFQNETQYEWFQHPSVATPISAVGETSIRSRNIGIQEIGEIFNDRLYWTAFLWKICCLATFEFPEDYQIESPEFSYAGASWILKIYPYFKLEQLNEPNFDMVLCRLHSEIPEHYVGVEIRPDQSYGVSSKAVTESFIFNSYSTQGNVIHFQLKEENIPGLNHLHFDILLHEKNTGLVKPTVANDGIPQSSMMLQNKVLQDYRDLFLTRSDCDVIIKVKGQDFAAHSVILKARSPVLASTFRNDMKEKATGIVDVEDCDPSVFLDFLRFLYCGELENLSVETVFSLFTIADKYDVPDLRTNCMNFIKTNISVDTFCDTIALALLHSEDELRDLCMDFFAKNLQDIIVTVKWQSFILENPIQGNELLIKVLVPYKK